jgi:hypothetical protein
VEELQQLLELRGFRGEVLSTTPDLRAYRGLEIFAWLSSQSDVPESYCILDDSDEMAELLPRLVRTTWARGLDDGATEAAIRILGAVQR